MLPEESQDEPRENNAALQFVENDEEDGWDDDDFDLAADLDPPAPAQAPTPREAPRRASGGPALSVDSLNNPDLVQLGPAPVIGGQNFRGTTSDMFGESASNVMGRATSPMLYAQVSQFPTCTQLRVWKWENGIPVGLGTIDATATEEDFVRQFSSAMPKKGEGKCQFKMRPIDIRGQELGQEATLVISEHHAALRSIREAEQEDRGSSMFGLFGRGMGGMRGESGSDEMARELTGMVEHMLATSDQRARHLEEALEAERERMREDELERTRERVDLATNAAQGVQAITERLMRDEAQRAERAMKAQEQQSNMLVTTLSTVFAQQQQAMQQQAAEQRRADEFRLQQERQRAEEERRAYHDRVKLEREEAERKRQIERDEMEARLRREQAESERRWQMEQARLEREREDRKLEAERQKEEARLRYEREKAEMQLRVQQDRERLERERMEHERKLQQEREDAERRMRMEMERMERDRQERREQMEREKSDRDEKARREREDAKLRDQDRQRQHERQLEEAKLAAQQQREHAERMMQLQKIEMEKRNSMGGLEMLAQFGLNPKEILPRLLNGGGDEDDDGEEGSGWTEAIPKVLGALAGMVGPRGGAPAQQAAAAQQAAVRQQAAAQQAAMQRAAMQRQIAAPVPDFNQSFAQAPAPPQPVPAQAPAQPQPQPQQAPQQAIPGVEAPAESTPVDSKALAKAAGMNLKSIRAARRGMVNLVRRVNASPKPKWEEVITAGIINEPRIFDYVKAVTVKLAIDEAGAEPELRDAVIVAMKESALVPNDLPYGDEA